MPVAVSVERSKKFDLKTLPGAYVVIARMSHGQKLVRGDLSSKMKFTAGKRSKDLQGEIDMLQKVTAHWDWSNLIEDHNLQDVDERVLNFKDVRDIDKIDAKIAEEVSTYIDELNNFEGDAEDPESPLETS